MLENPWSAVRSTTCGLGPLGSSLGPSSLAPVGIHRLLLSNLTTAHVGWMPFLFRSLLRSFPVSVSRCCSTHFIHHSSFLLFKFNKEVYVEAL